MRVKIGSETGPVSFEDPDEAKNFIEKKFREFEGDDRERLKVEVRKYTPRSCLRNLIEVQSVGE